MNLAERLFEAYKDDSLLFHTLNKILGWDRKNGDHYINMPLIHCYVDHYDKSVEVIFQAGERRMTKKEADQIFELGFRKIYNTYDREVGRLWYEGDESESECSPRGSYYDGECEDDRMKILKYREELTKHQEILHRIYIARNITLDGNAIEEQLRIVDKLFREENLN